MMLTYALAESTAWKCCLISLFAFSPDPILPYQYTAVLTWSSRPGDVPRLQISEKCSTLERGSGKSNICHQSWGRLYYIHSVISRISGENPFLGVCLCPCMCYSFCYQSEDMFTKWDHLGRYPQVEMTGKGARCGSKVEFLNLVLVRIRRDVGMVEYWFCLRPHRCTIARMCVGVRVLKNFVTHITRRRWIKNWNCFKRAYPNICLFSFWNEFLQFSPPSSFSSSSSCSSCTQPQVFREREQINLINSLLPIVCCFLFLLTTPQGLIFD